MTDIEPKEFVIKTFKIGNGARIKRVLNHYYKHMNYYRKENLKPTENNFETAQRIFKIQL